MRSCVSLVLPLTIAVLASCASPSPSAMRAESAPSGKAGVVSPSALPSSKVALAAITGQVTAPSSLVAAGGLNLIGNDGSSMVAAGAGNMVAAGGGNMVAAGGGNYALLGNKAFEDFAAKVIKANVEPYFKYTEGVTGILTKAAELLRAGSLKPGQPFIAAGSTYVLTRAGSGGLITAYKGAGVKPDKQTLGLRFENKRKGAAVYRDQVLGVKFAFATTFDLDGGRVTADNLVTPGGLFGNQRTHWEFTRAKSAAAGQPDFTMRATAFHRDHAFVLDGLYAVSANFFADGRGAAIGAYQDGMAGKPAGGEALRFFPNVLQLQKDDNSVAHDFYVDAKGEGLDAAVAGAELKAILPKDTDVVRPFALDPTKGDPYAEPAFSFPE